MPKGINEGTSDSGQSTVTETASAEEKAAISALENDDTSWDDGEEVESRFEAQDEDDSAATDEDDSEAEESDDDVELEDESDDADSEESDENDQDTEDSDDSNDAESTTDIEAERKRHNDEMARARIAERKAREEADTIRKQAQEATIQQYLDEAGEDEAEQARRQNDVEQFRLQEERIDFNTERLQTGIERALQTVDLFRTGSQAAKEELAASLDEFERQFVETDKHGRPLKIKTDPTTGKQADVVAYLQRKAERIKQLQGEGAQQQVKSKKKEATRTLTPPTRAPKKSKVDADLDAFDEEARR